MAVSPVYETVPVGGPPQPDYLNAVLLARTALPSRALLGRLHEIEAAFDRERSERWARARWTSTSSPSPARSARTRT